jgi:hypothetical protein
MATAVPTAIVPTAAATGPAPLGEPLPAALGAVLAATDAADAPALLATWAGRPATDPAPSWTLLHVPPAAAFAPGLHGRSIVLLAAAGTVVAGLRALTGAGAPPAGAAAVPLAGLSPTTIDVLLRSAGPASGLLALDVRRLPDAPARFEALGLAPAPGAAVEAALRRLARALAPWRPSAHAPSTTTPERGPTTR